MHRVEAKQPLTMQLVHRGILYVSTSLGAWLGMQDCHELGHVVVATLGGGRVARVVLHPLAISRTDLAENPHPLAVAWGGPMIGVLLPLLLRAIAAHFRFSLGFLLRFFAGFCLVANGAYLAIGSFGSVGDAGELLRQGCPIGLLWSFGLIAIPGGFWLWNGQGRHFGLGSTKPEVQPGIAYASLASSLLLVALGLLVGGV